MSWLTFHPPPVYSPISGNMAAPSINNDSGLQILVKVSVALHDVLKTGVADSTGFFVDGARLDNNPAQTVNSVL